LRSGAAELDDARILGAKVLLTNAMKKPSPPELLVHCVPIGGEVRRGRAEENVKDLARHVLTVVAIAQSFHDLARLGTRGLVHLTLLFDWSHRD
jgi:hypothetical protein